MRAIYRLDSVWTAAAVRQLEQKHSGSGKELGGMERYSQSSGKHPLSMLQGVVAGCALSSSALAHSPGFFLPRIQRQYCRFVS